MCIFNFFKSLQQSWHYTRTLTERISGDPLGFAQGTACFTPVHLSDENNNIVHYKEAGTFMNGSGKAMEAHQEYLYIYKKQTNRIEKHFSKNGVDTGLFYVLNFDFLKQKSDALEASGAHMCIKDHYQAKYQFFSFSKLQIEYVVIGPTKNYRSSTLFEKLEAPFKF